MSIYPYVDALGEVKNGIIITAPHACLGKMRRACSEHYANLKPGVLCRCPYGLYSYKHANGGINTGLLIKGKVNKRAKKYTKNQHVQAHQLEGILDAFRIQVDKIVDEPLAPITELKPLAKSNDLQIDITTDKSRSVVSIDPHEKAYINDLVHDLRLLNARMFDSVDGITREPNMSAEGKRRVGNIEASVEIMKARMQIYDILSNERVISGDDFREIAIHGAFLKAHRIQVASAQSGGIQLKHGGDCFGKVMGHNTFAIIPFLLFDNAVKYSPPGESVDVRFQEARTSTVVIIKNIGPVLNTDECTKVFERGWRGTNVKISGSKFGGQGIGLYVVKKICELHNIDIKITSEQCRYRNEGVPYSMFEVTLSIPRSS